MCGSRRVVKSAAGASTVTSTSRLVARPCAARWPRAQRARDRAVDAQQAAIEVGEERGVIEERRVARDADAVGVDLQVASRGAAGEPASRPSTVASSTRTPAARTAAHRAS